MAVSLLNGPGVANRMGEYNEGDRSFFLRQLRLTHPQFGDIWDMYDPESVQRREAASLITQYRQEQRAGLI